MNGAPDLAARAASLLEADPGLVRVLGLRDATASGHRRVLPVLTVPSGPWSPPARAALGAGTVALTVLEGLLTDGDALLGPRDVFDAWGRRWTVCARVRMAVIGDAFASALPPSHAGPSRPPLNAGASVPAAGRVLDDRVLELLWRIALRWGRPSAAGVALPEAVDARALSLVLGIGEPEAGLALETLRERGVILLAGAVHLRLTGVVHASRRDRLLAAAARQLALARAAHDDCLAVCEGLDAGGRRPRAMDRSVIG